MHLILVFYAPNSVSSREQALRVGAEQTNRSQDGYFNTIDN